MKELTRKRPILTMSNIIPKRFGSRGFTLIELLVVIAIIGILSSVVLASLNTARQKGRDARRVSDIKQLQLALELYYDAHGYYPPVADATNLAGSNGYIASIPTDPTSNAAYSYTPYALSGSASTCSGYHLGATLENSSNTALTGDADISAAPTGYVICTAAGAPASDFSGTDPVYDVKS